MKTIKMQVIRSEYSVQRDEHKTLDQIWLSEKSWFSSGTTVLISDEHGNSKIFIKE